MASPATWLGPERRARIGARGVLLAAGLPVFLGPNGFLRTSLTLNHYDHQRLLEIVSLVLLGLLVFLANGVRRSAGAVALRINPWAGAGVALFFGAGLISALRSAYPIASFLEWGTLLLAFGAALAVAGARRHLGREGDIWLLGLVIAGVTVYSSYFLASYIPTTFHRDVIIVWDSPFYHFANVRFLNQFQTWTLPLMAAATLWAGSYSRVLQGLLGAIGAFWWALLFATGGRGALLAATISTLLVLLALRNRAYRWLSATLLLVAAGVVFYWLLFVLPGGVPGFGRAAEAAGSLDHNRILLWSRALGLAWAQPFLGIGPMLFGVDTEIAAHPHNAFLQLSAEWGLPAASGAVLAVLVGLVAWCGAWRGTGWEHEEESAPWMAAFPPALTAALLAGLGHSAVSGILVMPMSQVMAILTAGWAWGIHCAHRPAPGEPALLLHGEWRPAVWVTACFAVGMAAILPGTVASLKDLPEAHRHYRQTDGFRFHPRFWLQGDLALRPWAAPGNVPETTEGGNSS